MADDAPAREDAARQTFARLASHTLRGATNTIANSLALLATEAEGETLSRRQRTLLENAGIDVARLIQLSDDLQTLTHQADRSLRARRELFPLTTLLRESVAQAQTPLAPSAPRDIRWRASPALAPALGDVALARRALAALIENALRFSEDEKACVVVEARKRRDRAVIRVQDAGAGIASAEAERIFEPLYVGARPYHHIGVGLGVGLGLAAARACAEVQGGRVWLEPSALDGARGATFILELPLMTAEAMAGG